MNGANIVNGLAALLMVTSVLVIGARRPTRAALLYSLQSFVVISVFAALAFFTGTKELYIWALTGFATKVVLVPAILYRYLGKFDQAPLIPSMMKPTAAILLAAVALTVSAAVMSQLHLPGAAAYKPALMVSFAHFFLGVACIITQRNILKQVFGYCLMENGSHLTLALLAYQAPELVETGVATDAIFAVIVMTVIAIRIQATVHSLDSDDLMTLKG